MKDVGKLGEELATIYLRSKGFEILERNWRYRHKEIDIIAKEENTTVFVEVKTRKSLRYGHPEEGLSAKQLRDIIACADEYLQEHPNHSIRFDVLSIKMQGQTAKEIYHIRDVYI